MLVATLPDGFNYRLVRDLAEYHTGLPGEPPELLAVGVLSLAGEGVEHDLLDIPTAPIEDLDEVTGSIYLDGLRHNIHRIFLRRDTYSVNVSTTNLLG
jgi:hypothetical protein